MLRDDRTSVDRAHQRLLKSPQTLDITTAETMEEEKITLIEFQRLFEGKNMEIMEMIFYDIDLDGDRSVNAEEYKLWALHLNGEVLQQIIDSKRKYTEIKMEEKNESLTPRSVGDPKVSLSERFNLPINEGISERKTLNEENGNGLLDRISEVNSKLSLNEENGANATERAETVEHRDTSPLPQEYKKDEMYFRGRALMVEV